MIAIINIKGFRYWHSSYENKFMTYIKYHSAPKILLPFLGLALPALAFQPLITDDTGTQGQGGNQLEISFSQDRANKAGETVRTQSWPVVYTRGLSETLDVFAGFSYARIRSGATGSEAGGGGNPSFGAKWRFYENEESKTSFALKPEIMYPVSAGRESAGLGRGKTSANLSLIVTQELAFGAIHLNLGAGRNRYRDILNNPDSTTTRASIAPVWDVAEQWKLALDLGTESARAGGIRTRTNFSELGAIYSPGKDLDFALGIVRSSGNDDPRTTTHSASAGLTWRFQ
jgi:hypothetical protein